MIGKILVSKIVAGAMFVTVATGLTFMVPALVRHSAEPQSMTSTAAEKSAETNFDYAEAPSFEIYVDAGGTVTEIEAENDAAEALGLDLSQMIGWPKAEVEDALMVASPVTPTFEYAEDEVEAEELADVDEEELSDDDHDRFENESPDLDDDDEDFDQDEDSDSEAFDDEEDHEDETEIGESHDERDDDDDEDDEESYEHQSFDDHERATWEDDHEDDHSSQYESSDDHEDDYDHESSYEDHEESDD